MPRTQLQQLEQSVEDLEQRLRGLEVEDRSKFRFITKELIGFLGLSATLLSALKFSKPQNSLQQNLVCSEVEPSKIRECGLLSNYNYTDFLGHKEETRTQLFYMKSFAQNKQQATQIIDKANNGEKVRITSLEIAKEILGQCNENLLRKIVMQVAGDDNSLQLLRTASLGQQLAEAARKLEVMVEAKETIEQAQAGQTVTVSAENVKEIVAQGGLQEVASKVSLQDGNSLNVIANENQNIFVSQTYYRFSQ